MVALVVGCGGLRAVRCGATNSEEIWKQAEADLQTGKLDSVDSAAEQLSRLRSRYIEADPRDRWSRLALAENYRRMGRTDDAEQPLAGFPSGTAIVGSHQ